MITPDLIGAVRSGCLGDTFWETDGEHPTILPPCWFANFFSPPCYYQDGDWPCDYYDNFGYYTFPKADVVGAGTKLHVRLAKPERPGALVISHPRKSKYGVPVGQRQPLKHTFGRVERDGKTVAWDVFFRVGEPEHNYYVVVHARWKEMPGTHVSYGDAGYGFHVKTR